MNFDELDAIYQRNSIELFALAGTFSTEAEGKTGRELLDLRRQECVTLIELLNRHKRELDWRAGEKVEPTQHFGAAVLVGKMGDV